MAASPFKGFGFAIGIPTCIVPKSQGILCDPPPISPEGSLDIFLGEWQWGISLLLFLKHSQSIGQLLYLILECMVLSR